MTTNKGFDMQFQGTNNYIASDDLLMAVNAAIRLQKPLLIKGEPGTGKTLLAEEVASALQLPIYQWNIKSTTKAQQGLYEYDAVSRLRDSQLGEEKVHDIGQYIVKGQLWQAFESETPAVVLIDEIDKADLEFPNDLLHELDKMEFYVYETKQTIKAKHRPIIIITSNNEKELPAPFLRRCFFHYIHFPEANELKKIVLAHFPDIQEILIQQAMQYFYKLRTQEDLKKKPSTSEFLDWLRLLMIEDISPKALADMMQKNALPPMHGALLKNEQDISLLKRLAHMFVR